MAVNPDKTELLGIDVFGKIWIYANYGGGTKVLVFEFSIFLLCAKEVTKQFDSESKR